MLGRRYLTTEADRKGAAVWGGTDEWETRSSYPTPCCDFSKLELACHARQEPNTAKKEGRVRCNTMVFPETLPKRDAKAEPAVFEKDSRISLITLSCTNSHSSLAVVTARPAKRESLSTGSMASRVDHVRQHAPPSFSLKGA